MSVFATTEGNAKETQEVANTEQTSWVNGDKVITPIKDTGLYLEGDREAKESSGGLTKDGDYYVGVSGVYVNIDTSGWKLLGDTDCDIYFADKSEGRNIELGDLKCACLWVENETPATINVTGNAEFTKDHFVSIAPLTVTGPGALTCHKGINAKGTSEEGTSLTFDLARLNVENNESTDYYNYGVAIAASTVDIKGGTVIAQGNNNGLLSSGIVATEGKINVAEDAEVFTSGNVFGIGVTGTDEYLDCVHNFGSAEVLNYDQKDQVRDNLEKTTVVVDGVEIYTYGINNANGTVAKTVYSEASQPEPETHIVTFKYQDGVTEDMTIEVVDGETMREPVEPTREGYKFNGWFLTPEAAGSAFDFENTPITENITLYADWIATDTPTPPVNPTNGGNGAQGGVSTGDSAMPIIFITLGFAAAVAGFYGFRRLRDR